MGQLLVVTNGYERLPFSLNVNVKVQNLTLNAADYARFVACLYSIPTGNVTSGIMYPTQDKGDAIELRGVKLFVGKALYKGSRSGG